MELQRKPAANEKEILGILIQAAMDATTEENEASDTFQLVMGQFPSGLPHPDGSQRIADSSHRLSSARKKLAAAQTRLNDFLKQGIIPEDLQVTKVH
jgi:hypothetical protein